MTRTRLALLVVVVAAVTAVLAPSTSAGTLTTIDVNGFGAGAASVGGFGLSCTIVNGVETPPCTTGPTIASGAFYVITATAAPGTTVTGFTGCPGTISVNAAGAVCTFTTPPGGGIVTVTVNMQPSTRTLVVQKSGTGTATVTSSPAGINCGPTCIASFANNSLVTLTVSLSPGTTFNGWGGACTPAGRNLTCVLAMTSNNIVSISTSLVTFPLTVTTAGNGTGTVTSNPAGITCPGTCAASVVGGTTVSLSANPASGSVFSGFSGACTGNSCTIAVNSAASVTATFAPAAVQAAVVGNKIRKTGPRNAQRVINVTIDADEEISIVMRIQRSGVTLQTRRIRSFGPETGVVLFPIRNGIAAGKAQLLVTMTNEDGAQKSQRRNLRIPSVS
jgi:hypothetical protein